MGPGREAIHVRDRRGTQDARRAVRRPLAAARLPHHVRTGLQRRRVPWLLEPRRPSEPGRRPPEPSRRHAPCISRATLPQINAYKQRMGWTFPWASSNGSDYQFDFGFALTDLFDVEQYPTATFRSTGIGWNGLAGSMTGDLTIKGVTRPVTLEVEYLGYAQDPWGNDRTVFSARGPDQPRGLGRDVEHAAGPGRPAGVHRDRPGTGSRADPAAVSALYPAVSWPRRAAGRLPIYWRVSRRPSPAAINCCRCPLDRPGSVGCPVCQPDPHRARPAGHRCPRPTPVRRAGRR